jgi:glycosyltransferase involved in cell wall biosynthesis
MKIAYDYQIFSGQGYGGISRYFHQLSEGILKTENELRIFSPIHRNNYIKNLEKGVVKGIWLNKFHLGRGGDRVVSGLNRLISKPMIKNYKPDIVHETFYSKHSVSPTNTPIIITVYDMIHELFDFYQPPYHRGWDEKNVSINRADHIICISHNTRKDLIRLFGVDERKISVVHLGFERSNSLESVNKNINGGRPYLLYVGWREWYKNFPRFLKAVAQSERLIKDFNIVAFGGGPFTDKEIKLMSDLGFNENQIEHVSGSDEMLASYYTQAAALVNPSLYEGFGYTPLEAMSYNCPVISSNTSSMPEVIGSAAEYFDPESVDGMTFSIEKVVYSKSLSNELTDKGKERCKLFPVQKCVDDTLEIYRKLA